MLITGGDRIPADIRVISVTDFKVENSSLTGESALIPLVTKAQSEVPTESRNVAFMSSMAMTGTAVGVVIRTGDGTMIGAIAKLASATSNEQSTLQKEVKRFVYFVAVLALVMAAVFFSIAMGRGLGFPTALINGFISVMVANVP